MRVFLPKEHGLWCWAGAPLVAAGALAPGAGTALGATALLVIFAAGNAARRSAWGPAIVAGGAGLAVAAGAAPFTGEPALEAVTVFGLVVAGLLATWLLGGVRAGNTLVELVTMSGFVLAGAGLALANGAAVPAVVLVGLATLTWETVGLWWVRSQLALVLPGRTPWAAGPAVVAGLVALTGLAALALDRPALGFLPALYLLRIAMTPPAARAADARRIGLGEAGWTALATLLAVRAVS